MLALFFISGVAGLVYEVAWTRQLGLLFGQTVQAASLVLACYFLGMAIGYALAKRGRLVALHPLKGYALAEGLVTVWALALPLALEALDRPLLAPLLNSEIAALQLAARALFAALLLMPATIAMGTTLPFMARALASKKSELDRTALAYSLNILGAFFGVAAATLFLLPVAGVFGSTYAAAALSATCAVLAWLLAAKSPLPRQVPPSAAGAVSLRSRWTWLAAVSGFNVLAIQVLYVRLFSLVFHNSVYTFGAVVAVFLIGLSLGSAFVSRYGRRFELESLLSNAFFASGIAVAASVMAFLLWTDLDYFEAGDGFAGYLVGAALFAGMILLVPVTVAGVILPLAWQGARRSAAAEHVVVGDLTSVNTVAASVGSLTASFFLLPTVGIWGAFTFVMIAYFAAGVLFFQKKGSVSQLVHAAVCLAFSAAFFHAARGKDGTDEDERLIRRWESAYGWVDVVEFVETKHKQLRQNIHYGLGSTGSVTMERRQAHIPMLLHPNPQNVLLIGLATGITSGGAVDHPNARVDVVELIPDVIKGAALFGDYNRDIVKNPRARIVVNDGRHFLKASGKQYDVIAADLFVPWESHTGYLYTTEHFETALAALAPGGIYCQWLPLWQLGAPEFELIVETFASVFPRATLWYAKLDEHWTAVGLVGSREVLEIDSEKLALRLARAPAAIPKDASWFKDPAALYKTYVGDWRPTPGAEHNTDEHPLLEFRAPVTAWTRGSRLRYDELRAFQKARLLDLPLENVRFVPAPGSEAPDRATVRRFQVESLAEKD